MFPGMRNRPNIRADREAAARWAADLIGREDWVILDTETTGFEHSAQIIQITVINHLGEALLDSLVKPSCEIGESAFQVHGLTAEKLVLAPIWPEVYPRLCEIVAGKTIVIFNDQFDIRMIYQTCFAFGLDLAKIGNIKNNRVQCAMLQYSAWVGEYNYRRGNYKWQKLPGGDHSALGDCRATLEIIRQMAASLKDEVA